MSYKTAVKSRKKTASVNLSAALKKHGGGVNVKLPGYGKSAKAAASAKGMSYTASAPSGFKMHDGAQAALAEYEVEEPASFTPADEEADLAEKLVSEVADDSPDVNALCERYQLRREELGRLTGFSLRALAEWASGKLPSQPAKRRLHEVRRLLDALAEVVKRESIPRWLHQPNPAFDRLTPLQVIEVGEIDRLWAMVHDLGSGQPE
jgi:DNA-binding transcriptional regulator YiaG